MNIAYFGLSKNNLRFGNIYFKFLILAIVFSFVTGLRFDPYDTFFYFDVFIFIYILSAFFFKPKIKISNFTLKLILISSLILVPSLILLIFANDKFESLQFLSQYIFTITILPLFLNIIDQSKNFKFLLKSLLFGLIIVSISFFLFYFKLIDSYYHSVRFGNRFAIGEMTPNEMGHYFILTLFLISILIRNRFSILLKLFTISSYVFTMSKTLYVQLAFYFFLKVKKTLIFLLLIILFIIFPEKVTNLFEEITAILSDFSPWKINNLTRIQQFLNVISYIPDSIFFPGYHSLSNLNTNLSIHNGFLSYLINFGFFSFLLLIFFSFFYIAKNLNNTLFKFILFFIFLDLVVLIFNPLINSRLVWFPLYIYIYSYHWLNKKNV